MTFDEEVNEQYADKKAEEREYKRGRVELAKELYTDLKKDIEDAFPVKKEAMNYIFEFPDMTIAKLFKALDKIKKKLEQEVSKK